ncbi:PaaI family thioesterase [Aminipila butyrica]|uniref:PaaI family thioesterase n=1 Tax=Aminipila butyrica TaxID=433296 RepID=A0A858BVU3_9FIRM|nr:PaaI family thioesterase [Aminipila butyrica]QIB69542.1 PaaI family thioesterase [Aminipila butyrica]
MSIEEIFKQDDLEKIMRAFIAERRREPERLNEMLNIQLITCNKEERTAIFEFPIYDWELNPNNALHGGITASMMDYALGLFANCICRQLGGVFSPTVDLNVRYLLPIAGADKVQIKAQLLSSGASLLTLNGEASIQKGGPLVAAASATYKVLQR